MQNVKPKHIQLDQDSNDYRIQMSNHTPMDEEMHGPANWILREEDQEKSHECGLLADCICSRIYYIVV